MSKRDWFGNHILALVSAAVLLCVVGIVGAIMSEQYVKRHHASAEYQRNAESDRRAASHKVAEACQDRTGDAFRACISEHIETYYRDQAANEDLQAQQDMAYWAGALFFSSTILTGIGIYLLYGTLSATRETLHEAERATAIANRTVDETSRIGEAQVRAYLYFESVEVDYIIEKTRKTCIITVVVRNTGQSPARRVVGYANEAISTRDEKGQHIPDIPANGTREFVAVRHTNLEEIDSTLEDSGEETGTSVFVDVAVEYRDVFESPIPHRERSRFAGIMYLDKDRTKNAVTPGSRHLHGKLETEYSQA